MHSIIHAVECRARLAAGALVALCVLVSTAAAAEPALLAESRFGFRGMVEGEPFEGLFGDFQVAPRLDAQRLPVGFAVATDLRTVDSGNADRDAEMRTAEWFDVARHPSATFRAASVVSAAHGGYVTHGELVLKGFARPLAVPFRWLVDGQRMRMTGEVQLDRRWFGVGPDDVSSVAAEVTVFFDLVWEAR